MKTMLEKLNTMLGGKMPICAYCPPNPKIDWNGEIKETQINDKYYKLMADSGVNIVYGHEEIIGTSTEFEAFNALELAEKYGLVYLVKDIILKEFVSLGNNGYKAFSALDAQEKENLKQRFIDSIKKYKNYKAFGGVVGIDEPGIAMFEGIAFAQSIFYSECADKIFYVNMYPSWVYECQYQYGPFSQGFSEIDDGLKEKNRMKRYDYFVDKYIQEVKPQLFSYDAYPVITLENFDDMVHAALFEHLETANRIMRQSGIIFFNFIQAGGNWEGCRHVRVPTKAEINLQINASIAYGAKGLQIFPYQYPSAWSYDFVTTAGLVDRDGNKTEMYDIFLQNHQHLQACSKILMLSKFDRLIATGQYKGYDTARVLKVKDCDCIFNGDIPLSTANTSYKEIMHISADNQIIAGCFDFNGETVLYITNTSTKLDSKVDISSMQSIDGYMIECGKRSNFSGKEINFTVKCGGGIMFHITK